MENFDLSLSTKIVFGKGTQERVGEMVTPYANKVLLHYGGGSIKSSGLYDQVTKSLTAAGISYVELGGVQPNPRLSLVKQGIELCRKENIDFILAVGGGSTIDSAKTIAFGTPYDGDVWDFFLGKAQAKQCLRVGTVLTIPAAGSEMSPSCVITNDETERKLAYASELMRPVFSILNPQLCMTLPKNQAANGITDMFAHVMERYFTDTKHVDLTDRMCEAVMRGIIDNGRLLMQNYDDYNLWAEIMWAGTVAHNDLLGVGREESWVSHGLEHEISAIYDIPHGQGLAIVFPSWIRHVAHHNPNRFVQFAVRVFDVAYSMEDTDFIIEEGVKALERFFMDLNQPIRLSTIDIDDKNFEKMAKAIDSYGGYPYKDALEVYKGCL